MRDGSEVVRTRGRERRRVVRRGRGRRIVVVSGGWVSWWEVVGCGGVGWVWS